MSTLAATKQTFELTDKQKALVRIAASSAPHILGYGGSRSGKTFGFCHCLAKRAIMAPESRHLVARLHNIDVKQSVMMDTWPKMMRLANPGVEYELNKSDQFVRLPNDAEVWFLGLDDKERVEKILGKEYATLYFNEASQLPYETIMTVRTRLAQLVYKTDGRQLPLKAYYDLNPTGKSHWTYLEFVLGLRPDNRMPLEEGSRKWIQLNPAENPNLPPEYLKSLAEMSERHRQRFLEGTYLSEVPGAIWPMDRIDATRKAVAPQLGRIVVGVDPSGSDGTGNGDLQGIVVAGQGLDDRHAYVLEDTTARRSPGGWGSEAVRLYKKWNADCIVAEANYGGAMVQSTIHNVDPNVKVKLVTASRGKHVRAEPVASLWEQRGDIPPQAHMVGYFPELEDEMTFFTTEGYQGAGSPNRADALVWAITELMLGPAKTAGVFLTSRHR